MSEREALGFTLPGFQGIAKARNPKGGGVAVLVRDTIPTKVVTCGITSRAEYATVCTPLSGTMLYWTSAYFPRASRVSMDALEALTGPALEHHVIGTDANAHHAVWDTRVPPNSAGIARESPRQRDPFNAGHHTAAGFADIQLVVFPLCR